MSDNKCFCHLNGYEVKDAKARNLISKLETEANEKINSLEAEANEKISSLEAGANEKIDSLEAEANEKINSLKAELNEKLGVVNSRINTFSTLPEGSTTGDAELIDIRNGADGKIYSSAGESVRKQIGDIREAIGTKSGEVVDITSQCNVSSQYYINVYGNRTEEFAAMYTVKMPVLSGEKYYISGSVTNACPLIAEYQKNITSGDITFSGYKMVGDSTDITKIEDYEYEVPENVDFISVNTMFMQAHPITIKKEYRALCVTEKTENKVERIDENSSHDKYPSAKSVYDVVKNTAEATNSKLPLICDEIDGSGEHNEKEVYSANAIDNGFNAMQEVLNEVHDNALTQENTKTINGESIAGSGNIEIKVGTQKSLYVTPKHKPFTTIINDCQNINEWKTHTLSSCEADEENYIFGNKSIRSIGGMVRVFNEPFDMLNNNLVLKLRINSISTGSNLLLQVLNTDLPSKSVVYNLMRGASTTPVGEWREITVPYSGYSHGSFSEVDFTKINYIRIYAEGEVDWNLQFIGLRPVVLDKGIITFTFDDGYKSQYTGLRILAEKGITGTLFYIPESNTNGSDDYLKIPDLQNLVNYYGTDIEVHGVSSYNDKTNEELITHWEETQRLFKENGLSDGKHMAYPNNMHEERVVQLSKRFFDSCRTIQYWIPSETFPPADNHRIRAISSIGASVNDVSWVKDKIDRAMLSKSWVVLTFHRIEEGNTSMYCSEADFREIVDYAISSGAYIMNYAEVIDGAYLKS